MTSEKMVAHKAFDKNMKCRGFQYDVGQTYTHEGDATTSGHNSHTMTSGRYTTVVTSKFCSPEKISGRNAPARAGTGEGIVLVEYGSDGTIIAMFASMVGQNGIEPGVWYILKDGKPVAVPE